MADPVQQFIVLHDGKYHLTQEVWVFDPAQKDDPNLSQEQRDSIAAIEQAFAARDPDTSPSAAALASDPTVDYKLITKLPL